LVGAGDGPQDHHAQGYAKEGDEQGKPKPSLHEEQVSPITHEPNRHQGEYQHQQPSDPVQAVHVVVFVKVSEPIEVTVAVEVQVESYGDS